MRFALVDFGSHVLPFDYNLLLALKGAGHNVAYYGSNTKYNNIFLDALDGEVDVRVHRFNISKSVATAHETIISYLKLLFLIWRQRKKYDKFILQFPVVWPLEFFVFLTMKEKFVFMVHNPVPHDHSSKVYFPFYFFALISSEIWFPSTYTANKFFQLYGNKFKVKGKVIQHGTMPITPHVNPIPYSTPERFDGLAYWGNVKPYKGIDLFARLAEAESLSPTGLTLEIHGKWSSELLLIRDKFISYGHRCDDKFLTEDELTELLGRDLVFVLPYSNASQSGVLYTLLHYGKFFIASDQGDLGEFLRRYDLHGLVLNDLSAVSVYRCFYWLQDNLHTVLENLQRAQLDHAWRNSIAGIG